MSARTSVILSGILALSSLFLCGVTPRILEATGTYDMGRILVAGFAVLLWAGISFGLLIVSVNKWQQEQSGPAQFTDGLITDMLEHPKDYLDNLT